MTRIIFLCGCLLLLASYGQAQTAGNSSGVVSGNLSGIVTDVLTGKPLSRCSVFLSGSSKGTLTGEDGSFFLGHIPRGKYQLIISAVGYATYVDDISGDNLPPALAIRLRSRPMELSSVTIEPYLKDGWERYGKFFLKYFIGTTSNASACQILNREDLRFYYYRKSNKLRVTAVEPLTIENKALGYSIQYQLEEFTFDYDNNIVSYIGYTLFHELPDPKGKHQHRWRSNRRKAYLGSFMHFMRSIYADRLSQEGFKIDRGVRRDSVNEQASDSLHDAQHGGGTSDSTGQATQYQPVNTAPLKDDVPKTLFFRGALTISYANWKEEISNQESTILLITPTMVLVEANGTYSPAREVLLQRGKWSVTETIANLLPYDYELH